MSADELRQHAEKKFAEVTSRLSSVDAQLIAERSSHAAAMGDAEARGTSALNRREEQASRELLAVTQQLNVALERAAKAEVEGASWSKTAQGTAAELAKAEEALAVTQKVVHNAAADATKAQQTAAVELTQALEANRADKDVADEKLLGAARRHGDELRAAREAAQDAAAAAVDAVREEMSRSSEEHSTVMTSSHAKTLAAVKAEAAAEVESVRRELLEMSARKLRSSEAAAELALKQEVEARQRAESEAAQAMAAAKVEVAAIEEMALGGKHTSNPHIDLIPRDVSDRSLVCSELRRMGGGATEASVNSSKESAALHSQLGVDRTAVRAHTQSILQLGHQGCL